ncbi:hypothetical protein BN7_4193 [Wickerhamomyces ciferrii]|uniref:Uncharacterized protein n=1 Tax=Wickerhamomyces ciferrii (strain ATCC 14091 / BCRC 22168 / CBS 111 / JCM 3599 / NBRC 0793 / NRRL Y-1031 F-60-10) TaxID=1206466 RepID=K0KTC3_WICCF|nr:uncharacterized protein BN7_4193 [Wickerhamomyces ciferrii]CCH44624.1 hypothetical protein BN7_4193 [Wickerhamomyces ciferrii]
MGYRAILKLTDEELFGTLCLEPLANDDKHAKMYQSCQSDRFIAALCDPRTSFEYKSNEVFQIVKPQNVEYEKISVKLKVKSHPTNSLSKEDIKNVKAYLNSWTGSGFYMTIFMRPDLNLSNVLAYLNTVGSLKSDKAITDDVCKINSERLPKILIYTSIPDFFGIFNRLLNF